MRNPIPTKGSLLLAEPFMMDPNFKRSVVLLCENGEEGTVGFTLNRPAGMSLNQVIEDIDDFDAPLYYGGPVQTDTLHFIHNLGDRLEDSVEISPGIYWGGNFEAVQEMIMNGEVKPDNFRFFLGYAGWSSDQLVHELQEKSWIIYEGNKNNNHVFEDNPYDLWRLVLQEMGGEYAMMVNFPEDPQLN